MSSNPVMQALSAARAAELDARIAEIERDASARERAAAGIVNTRLGLLPRNLSRAEWPVFESWAKEKALRSFPAKPHVVGFWILDNAKLGIDRLLRVVESISAFHVAEHHADPTLGPIVSAALDRVAPIAIPRSWKKGVWQRFEALPYELKVYVSARAAEQDLIVRNAQNLAAEAKALKRELEKTHGHLAPLTEPATA